MTEMNALPRLPAPPRALRIGDVAPTFQARSTLGEVKLSDYRGKWLVFFSHPADFTPVCTSEFVGIAKAAAEFAARDCALLGLSVDSLYSHLAWVRAIRQKFSVTIPFPIIEDPSMAVGRAYGMIEAQSVDSSAVRATYFIDPEGVIQAMTWYPINVGRSVDEMLRMVAALQRTSDGDVLAPEGWQPGEDLLVAPPQHQHAVLAGDDEHWFFQTQADAGK
ncbi:peroxiredoxin [Tardiphaga sp.]|uniref:peroxiredoxin n=1 Tax=Tardiphaga sp. TaxID=1926292 RepID=UPI00352A9864